MSEIQFWERSQVGQVCAISVYPSWIYLVGRFMLYLVLIVSAISASTESSRLFDQHVEVDSKGSVRYNIKKSEWADETAQAVDSSGSLSEVNRAELLTEGGCRMYTSPNRQSLWGSLPLVSTLVFASTRRVVMVGVFSAGCFTTKHLTMLGLFGVPLSTFRAEKKGEKRKKRNGSFVAFFEVYKICTLSHRLNSA